MRKGNNKSWYSITAAANNEAEIYVYDYIGYWGVTAKDFARDLKALGNVSKIKLHLNSPGGDVFDGTAIYNLLKDHSAEVETWIEGIAASMGSVIALAGDTVHIAENAYYMVHNPSTIARGDERVMDKAKELLAKVKTTMINLYASRTGLSEDEISQIMDDETWYTGAEAVEAGFATDTTAATEMAASFSGELINQFKNTPEPVRALVAPADGDVRFPPAVAGNPPETQEAKAMKTKPAATGGSDSPEITPEMKAKIEADAQAKFQADEQKRKDDIRAVFKGFDAHSTVMQACLDDMQCDASQAKDKLLVALGNQTPTPVHSYSVVVQEGEGIKRMKADAENAIAMRAFGEKRADGNGLAGYTMMEIARMMVQARGVNIAGMDKMAVVAAAFTHTSSDFSSVLANTANKAMLKGYEEAGEVFPKFTGVGNLSDFKISTRTDLGSFPTLTEVAEGAEFQYVTMGERAEMAALATYGKRFSITRQAIINDDLGVFTRIPKKMGRAAIRTVGDLVFSILLNNPKMADGNALFHASHNNLASAAGLTTAGIDAARVKMGKQKDGDAVLNLRPKFLICDVADEGAAKVALGSEYEVGATEKNNTVPNSVRGIAEVISDARLSGNNAWYLMADQLMHDTIEVLYLDGQQAPVLEQQAGWSIDGVEFKVRMDAAAKAWDAKGMVKTPKS
ncbi:ClpP-like prohead protease/major capsid protein fusion protein [Microbulbifer sp. SAOS-129_SWC]|uniref:ClpP-like prohead protease/major capsid protein fusion protein n=1 Tax=Microbulbifer sp. SAOS-129_SWC TaxID=3145235 RepID=UPI0032173D0C